MASPIVVSIPFLEESLSGETVMKKFDHERSNLEGFFSLQLKVTGAGSVTVTPKLSNNREDYIPQTAIFTAFDATSGPDGDGNDIQPFEPILHETMQLEFEVTGDVVLSAWLCRQ